MIHCTAGKDRTGWATGLILRLLGVKQEEIVDEIVEELVEEIGNLWRR